MIRLLSEYPAAAIEASVLRALEDDDTGVRAEAAETAGRVKLMVAVPLLMDWLEDPAADVRRSAVSALGRIGEPRSVASIVRALGDASADVRRASVNALAAIGTEDVVVPILGRLDDDDPIVRVAAVAALGRLGDARAVVPLVGRARDEAPQVRVAVSQALGSLGDTRAAGALVQGVDESNSDVALACIAALGRIGSDRAVPALVSASRSPDVRKARAAVAALGGVASDRARSALVTALSYGPVRTVASDALVRRSAEEPGVLVDLTRVLRVASNDAHVTAIAQTVTRIFDDQEAADARAETVNALLEVLEARRGSRTDVMLALARTRDERVLVPLLLQLSVAPATRRPVLVALKEYFRLRGEADGRAADPLLAILSEARPENRALIVDLLGATRAERALPVLRPLLTHEAPDLRRAAVNAIGAIGDASGADALLPLLEDDDPATRMRAAEATGRAASSETIDALLALLRREAPTDRHAVLVALARGLARLESEAEPSLAQESRDEVTTLLVEFVKGRDEALSHRAIDTLSAWGSEAAARALSELATDGPNGAARRLAIQALAGVDGSRELLVSALSEPRLEAAAAAALGDSGSEADLEALTAALRSPWPAGAAAAFGLARAARRGVLTDGSTLCAETTTRDPYIRANLAIVFAITRTRCDEVNVVDWLQGDSPVVRAAAARWAAALELAEAERASCALADLVTVVAEACADPVMPELGEVADVYAYGANGRALLRGRWVVLRFSDGTALVTKADANGHVRVNRAAGGALLLDDPITTPLASR